MGLLFFGMGESKIMVRRLKHFFALLLFLFLATSLVGFTSSGRFQIDDNEKPYYDIKHYSNIATPIFEPQSKPKFQGFDINADSNVVLAVNGDEFKGVLAYDRQGNYLFGFEINSEGDFLVEWFGSNINILFFRGNIIATYNQSGECLDVNVYLDNFNNAKSRDYLRANTSKTNKKDKFAVDNNSSLISAFVTNHTRLLHIAADGTKTVVYETNISSWNSASTTRLLCIMLAMIILAIYTIRTRKNYVNGLKNTN